ncbi:branched-chain amino acid ABC transporter substrate-binding protein [Gemmatimonadetes bacterium T265]|nr:branched-chain amino acid ABC transporter substrate-binding protein [Gemmatimonadetes bacterium T265]
MVAIGVAPSIAALTGLTGEDPIARGVALAVRDLNAEARRAGGPAFVVRMPAAKVRTAVSTATDLRNDPAVVGVVGPTDSQSALDAAAVYGDVEHDGARGVVAISPTATSPALSGRSPWVFRVCPDDAEASRAAARFAVDSLGVRRAAIVYRTDVFGKGWSRAFAAAFAAYGGTVVLRAPESTQVTEWAAPYAAYAKRGQSDLLVVAGSAADALPLVRAARAAGVRVPVLGSDALSDVRDPAARAEFGGVRYTAFFIARRPPTAVGSRFVAEYAALYGRLPGHQAALAYDAALLIGRAARAVGADRRAVRDYLAGVGSARPAFVGATGTIAFDARNDVVNKPVTLARVVDE